MSFHRFAAPLAAFLFSMSAVVAQTTWHVDVNAVPPGNGSPSSPYTSVQFAISRATTVTGDTVLVAPGVYAETIDFLGKDVVVRGTAGAAVTILDAPAGGSVATFANGETNAARLDGFTLRHGTGTGTSASNRRGGGVYCLGATPSLANLVVTGNTSSFGAGVYCNVPGTTIRFCSIDANNPGYQFWYGSAEGGGVFGPATIEDSSITNNRAIAGAGLRSIPPCTVRRTTFGNNVSVIPSIPGSGPSAAQGPITFEDCTFTGNSAYGMGAIAGPGSGVYAILRRCTISSNVAIQGAGGAVDCDLDDCDVFGNQGGLDAGGIERCVALNTRIHGNVALNWGGGAKSSTLTNCAVYDNDAHVAGGGLFDCTATRTRVFTNTAVLGAGVSGQSSLTQCTLHDNTASTSGGGIRASTQSDSPTTCLVRSCVVWNNAPDSYSVGVGTITASYSDVQGGIAGVGNVSADPRFFGPRARDFHLKGGSPCIDTGDPTLPLDANGSIADMGAFPFDPSWCAAPASWCVGKVNSLGCTPAVDFVGTPSVTGPDNFVVTGSGFVSNASGILFWGRNSTVVPFASGMRCVAGPILRTPVQNSGGSIGSCSGTYSFAFDAAYRAAFGVGAYDTIYVQWYARDSAQLDGTSVSLSNAGEFTVCP